MNYIFYLLISLRCVDDIAFDVRVDLLHVSRLEQISTTMKRNTSMLLALLISPVLLMVLFVTRVLRLLIYLILRRPLLLFPSNFPYSTCFSIISFLQVCPRNFICHSNIMWFLNELTRATQCLQHQCHTAFNSMYCY